MINGSDHFSAARARVHRRGSADPASHHPPRGRRAQRDQPGPGRQSADGPSAAAGGGGARLLVTGEAGVGRRTLLRETFGTAGLPFTELDCAAAEETGSEQRLAMARGALVNDGAGPTDLVVLCHLETLSVPQCGALGRILNQVPHDGQGLRIAAMWTLRGIRPNPPPAAPGPVRGGAVRGAAAAQAPGRGAAQAGRAETEPTGVVRGGRRGGAGCIPGRAATASWESSWWWLGRQNRLVVEVSDLPPRWRREADRARLTAIPVAEADAIAAALRDNGANKAAAALHLGISRSSLYRKMAGVAAAVEDIPARLTETGTVAGARVALLSAAEQRRSDRNGAAK